MNIERRNVPKPPPFKVTKSMEEIDNSFKIEEGLSQTETMPLDDINQDDTGYKVTEYEPEVILLEDEKDTTIQTDVINEDEVTTDIHIDFDETEHNFVFKYEDADILEAVDPNVIITKTPAENINKPIDKQINTSEPSDYDIIKDNNIKEKEQSITITSGDGDRVFLGTDDSEIILKDVSTQGWRLYITNYEEKNIDADGGERFKITDTKGLTSGFLYNKDDTNFMNIIAGESYTFPYKSEAWKFLSFSLIEISITGQEEIDLGGKNGILIGPKATSLFFYNVKTLKIDQKKFGNYKSVNYDENIIDSLPNDKKSFIFSAYHENTFFEGNEEINAICLECDDNNSYGWNVKFSNGLFMSINDLIEYQNRNNYLPADSGILYHGSNRLEFSGVKNIHVYKKPFYYGYGLEAKN